MWKLNKDKCTSCEECVKCCPCQVLEMQGSFPRIKDGSECTECSTCADTCPEQAIELAMDKTILENT